MGTSSSETVDVLRRRSCPQGPCMSSVQLLSVRRRTFEHCTSCCPSRDATMVVLTTPKINAKRRLPLHEKDLLRVGANVGSEMFSQVRSLAADTVSPPVSKRQNNHLAPSCRLSLKKLLRPAWPATIGARSSFSGARLAHEFPRSFLVAAIIFPHTKWGLFTKWPQPWGFPYREGPAGQLLQSA